MNACKCKGNTDHTFASFPPLSRSVTSLLCGAQPEIYLLSSECSVYYPLLICSFTHCHITVSFSPILLFLLLLLLQLVLPLLQHIIIIITTMVILQLLLVLSNSSPYYYSFSSSSSSSYYYYSHPLTTSPPKTRPPPPITPLLPPATTRGQGRVLDVCLEAFQLEFQAGNKQNICSSKALPT